MRLLTVEQVSQKMAIGVSTIWRDHAAGAFPRARRYGRCIRWVDEEIDDFIRQLPVDGSDPSEVSQ